MVVKEDGQVSFFHQLKDGTSAPLTAQVSVIICLNS